MRPPVSKVSIEKLDLGRRLFKPKHELIQIMSQTLDSKLAVAFAEVQSKCLVAASMWKIKKSEKGIELLQSVLNGRPTDCPSVLALQVADRLAGARLVIFDGLRLVNYDTSPFDAVKRSEVMFSFVGPPFALGLISAKLWRRIVLGKRAEDFVIGCDDDTFSSQLSVNIVDDKARSASVEHYPA